MPTPSVTVSASTTTQQPTLLGIAGELRNKIYRLVLCVDDRIGVTSGPFLADEALLHVCRQIRQEATPIFYSENSFLINIDGSTIRWSLGWLCTLGNVAPLIRDLKFHVQLSTKASMKLCHHAAVAWDRTPISRQAPCVEFSAEYWRSVAIENTWTREHARDDAVSQARDNSYGFGEVLALAQREGLSTDAITITQEDRRAMPRREMCEQSAYVLCFPPLSNWLEYDVGQFFEAVEACSEDVEGGAGGRCE